MPKTSLPHVPRDKPDVVLKAEMALDQVTSVLERDPRLRVISGVSGIHVERAHSASVVFIRYLRGAGMLRGVDYPVVFISSRLSDIKIDFTRDPVVRGLGLNARAALGALVENPRYPAAGVAHCTSIGVDSDWPWDAIGRELTVMAVLLGMHAIFGRPLARRSSDTAALRAFSREIMAMPREWPDRYQIVLQCPDRVHAKPSDGEAKLKASVFITLGRAHPVIGPGLRYRLYLWRGIRSLAKGAALVEYLNAMEREHAVGAPHIGAWHIPRDRTRLCYTVYIPARLATSTRGIPQKLLETTHCRVRAAEQWLKDYPM